MNRDRPIDNAEHVAKQTLAAYEAIRAINHLTITRPPLAAPDVYSSLGNLASLGQALGQALDQLGDCVARSVSAYRLHQDDGSDPAAAVRRAGSLIESASQFAESFGAYTAAAQQAINQQGHSGLRAGDEAGQ